MISIDGHMGEGGGQILRTCLTLSLITNKPFTISDIRSGRTKPGLRAQHLNAVLLAQQIGNARVEGANLGSTSLTFSPHESHSGKFHSNIGTAGSTGLVLQTVYLPLSLAAKPSQVELTGGTHVPYAPTFDWLNLHWLPYTSRIGLNISLELVQAGFFPKGGGRIRARINPRDQLTGLKVLQRGSLKQVRGISAYANLDRKIAIRQREQVLRRLGNKLPLNDIRIKRLPSKYKGTSILLICEFEYSQCSYAALGAPGKPAEKVADEVCEKVENLLSTDAAMDEYLADQLLLPLSLAKTDSTFSTVRITDHIRTNADVIKTFINPRIKFSGSVNSPGRITISPDSI